MLGAAHPLDHRQQRGELVAGASRIPRLPGPAGEVGADGQGVRVLGVAHPLGHRQQRGELVAGASHIPRLPGPAGEVAAGDQGAPVLGAAHPLDHRQQRGELVAGASRIPRLPGPVSEVAAGEQEALVLGAGQRLDHRHQRGELVAGASRIPRLPGPESEMAAVEQVARVLGAIHLHPCLKHPVTEIPCGCMAAAEPKIGGDAPHANTVCGEGCLGVRQQQRIHRPCPRLRCVLREGSLDQGRGGLPPRLGQILRHLTERHGLYQPVHRHRPVRRRADQRVPAQRGDSVAGCQRVIQKRH